MGKSPAHISLLTLLLSSEPHRNALLKVFTAAQVPKDTAPDNIEETVNSIFSNQISLADDELPSEEEVVKQVDAGFLEVCNYSEWVANIVPVEKKNGKVRVCIDYRDLNKARPKDNFPLPHIDVLVDNTARHTQFSFMDDFSRYNQNQMAEEDKIKTTFITMWGTFCYKTSSTCCKQVNSQHSLCAPEFHLIGARMREGHATHLGSVHLPRDAQRTRVRRSRHLLFTTRRLGAVVSPESRGTG
ncbi:hypothetical protein CRG98_006446 [Punica granatum]|uniref:Reverse transcriptase domain-containing protein n=1 Tax=Punica granatum TaxID=22663 RepID=A0A2I0KXH5_PUNGR|nr:hypothetical protein CRG98_006446 [Punica granatum]